MLEPCHFIPTLILVPWFDPVFISSLPHDPLLLSTLLSTVRTNRSCLNRDRELIAKRSNLKPDPQRPTVDGAADYRPTELTFPQSYFFFQTIQHIFLKLSLIAASGTAEMLCTLTFIRSDTNRRNINKRRSGA
ncbi:hypothetical protein AMECASPLE_008755 [Ameca splendens]|uniref:Uncharacterized protein n=1 Tax=Ameca splendens TaxID=208324 RepID=A0ABV0YXW8_9TELE